MNTDLPNTNPGSIDPIAQEYANSAPPGVQPDPSDPRVRAATQAAPSQSAPPASLTTNMQQAGVLDQSLEAWADPSALIFGKPLTQLTPAESKMVLGYLYISCASLREQLHSLQVL